MITDPSMPSLGNGIDAIAGMRLYRLNDRHSNRSVAGACI
jgi:hypothetical protein